jgi:hypothetical protein
MANGKVTVGTLVLIEESLSLDDLIDVTSSTPAVGETLVYKDNAIDSAFTTGWHSTQLSSNDLSDVDTTTSAQNDILAYNVSTTDPTYVDGFVPKNIASIFTDLEATVNSIVGVNTSKIRASVGDVAKTDMVLFTDTVGTGGISCSIGSNGDNNILQKKEPADGSFSFVEVLGKGSVSTLTYPSGTVLRSSKGIYGFTGPVPTPLGPQSFAIEESQFYVAAAATVTTVSLGTEISVSLLSGDRLTTISGPTIVAAYQLTTFSCPSVGEYYVTSSGPICASVSESGSNIRPLIPMSTELLSWNTGCLVSALEASTTVTYYKRDGTSGTVSVSPGTAVGLGAGSNTLLSPTGCVRITADKPISVYTGTDSIGTQTLSGFPVSQAAQLFSNPSFIDSSTSYGTAGIAIASLYEGTASVYTSAGVLLDTFTYIRNIAVTTAADQVYPAAGRWKPSDVSTVTTWSGGYVETSTPAVAIFNTAGDTNWSSTGQEYFVAGSTPTDIKADIKKINEIWRRRDISTSGVVTWNVC